MSSFLVYWLYEMMSTTELVHSWLMNLGLISGIFHFGISSWVFLKFARTGRVISIVSSIFLSVWPIAVISTSLREKNFESAIIFTFPIVLNGIVIRNQVKTYLSKEKPDSFIRAFMILLPLAVVIGYAIYTWN